MILDISEENLKTYLFLALERSIQLDLDFFKRNDIESCRTVAIKETLAKMSENERS